MTTTDITSLVDELGALQHEISKLAAREAALKAQLKALGCGELIGNTFSALVSSREVTKFDAAYKARVAALVEEHLTRQFITAHTTVETELRITVRARQSLAA